jgi:periplasmic nitrate reductase NapD
MSRTMAPTTPAQRVGRREFLHGRWGNDPAQPSGTAFEIASILVQARPERLDEVARAIDTLPGAQIYSRDARGKLVVVIEASGTDRIGATLNTISLLPGVLTAALVFHGSDEA